MLVTCIAKKDNTIIYKVRTEPNWIKVIPYHSNSLHYNAFKTIINEEVAQTYETEESAEKGHEKWVRKYMSQLESEISEEV